MKIRGGALLARAFAEKGITHVFTLSGGFCNPALEGFADCGMPVINAPHEQVAGHAGLFINRNRISIWGVDLIRKLIKIIQDLGTESLKNVLSALDALVLDDRQDGINPLFGFEGINIVGYL